LFSSKITLAIALMIAAPLNNVNWWNSTTADFTPAFSNVTFIVFPTATSLLVSFIYSYYCVKKKSKYVKKGASTLKLLLFLFAGIASLSTIFYKRNENSYELLSYSVLAITLMALGGYDYISDEIDSLIIVDGSCFFITLMNVVQLRTNLWIYISPNPEPNDKLDSFLHIILFVLLFLLSLSRCVNNICCCCGGGGGSDNGDTTSSNQVHGAILCEDEANLFQRFYFCWILPMLRIGYAKERLDMNDLPTLASCDEPVDLFKYYINIWKQHCENKNIKNPSLSRVLHQVLGYRFWKAGFLLLLGQTAGICIPILTHELLSILETRENKDEDNNLYVKGGSLEYLIVLTISLSIMSAMQSILTHQFWIVGVRVSMHSQILLQTHVLDKVMNLNHQSRSITTEGEMSNLISSDSTKIATSFWACMIHWGGWCSVGTIVIAMYNLHFLLGYGAYAGVFVILIFMPLSYFLSQRIKVVYKKMMSYRDKRGKVMVENLRAIRVLKAFSAETAAWNDINEVRTLELKWQRYQQLLNIGNIVLSSIGPVLVNAASFLVFSLYGGKVTAAKIFTSLLWFTMLQNSMLRIPNTIISTINVFGSLERLEKFLSLGETKINPRRQFFGERFLNVQNCAFGWYDGNSNTSTSGSGERSDSNNDNSSSNYGENTNIVKTVVKNVTFKASEGDFICLVGPVGCGKSSVLAGLTHNNVCTAGTVEYNGAVAFVTQQPWLRNSSILENIIDFDFQRDHHRHNAVINVDKAKLRHCIEACALQADLDIFPDGIDTLVGSNGVTLSGGQRQRISLARAMYSDADIYILDDVLSAVDGNVGKHIFDNCIVKSLIEKNKIVILATHAEQYIKNSKYISGMYTIDPKTGKFISTKLVKSHNDGEEKYDIEENNNVSTAEKKCEDDDTNGSQFQENKAKRVAEERKKGYVSLQDIKQYVYAFGICTALTLLFLFIVRQLFTIGQQYWLTIWVRSVNPNSTYYVYVYGSLGLILVAVTAISCYFIVVGSISGAKSMHDNAMKALLCSRVTFFDVTPFGVIVNRMLNDISKIDSIMSRAIVGLAMAILQVLSTVGVVIFVTPYVMIIFLIMVWPYYVCGLYYRWSSRELRRLTSTTRSPIMTNFSETVSGMDVIRAYCAQDVTFLRYTDALRANARTYYMSWVANQWVTAVLEAMGVFIIFISTGSAVYLHVFQNGIDPSLIGFCLTYTLTLPGALMWLIRNLATAETELVAVERIVEYSQIEKEDSAVVLSRKRVTNVSDTINRGSLMFIIEDKKEVSLLRDHAAMDDQISPITINSTIEFQNVTMSYRNGLPPVLKNVNFEVKGGQKVAVIGRTGAGKTSIFMALLRFYECAKNGAIYVNNKNIRTGYKDINDYRKHIAYVPQEAILFSGTIRTSLTKNREEEISDKTIWDVLEKVKMKAKVESLQDGLNTEIIDGGTNFSHGERQLLCLARALLNKNASMILADEATASVDNSNEQLIQQVILNLPMTVLYICHRLVNLEQFDLLLMMEDGKVKKLCKPEDRWKK
jgi:ATP-binding cassette, subfamily C (CFTR/MRP), member 1